MPLVKIKENALLLAFCLFAWLLLKDALPFCTLTVLCLFLYQKTKSPVVVASFILLCLICVIPRVLPGEMKEGRAVLVSGRYSVLAHGLKRVLVYTKEPLKLDSVYAIEGKVHELEAKGSFFGFDSKRWLEGLNVNGRVEVKDIHLQHLSRTPRFLIQQKIEGMTKNQSFLYKVLLNIRIDETDSLFFADGFSYAGILQAMDTVLKFHLDRNRRKKVILILNVLLCLLYGFPFILVQSLLFKALSLWKERSAIRTGVGYCLLMMLYPHKIFSAGFLIPAVYRISFLWGRKRRAGCFWLLMCMQSFLFHEMNPLESVLYPLWKNVLGFLWIYALFSLFIPLPAVPVDWMEKYLSFMDLFSLKGDMFGIGIVFYVMILLSLRKNRNFAVIASVWLLVFQCTGLFHPCAEVTFIDVQQGDSILLRMPLNTENVLIDTGKPEQWKNLHAYLDGLGIRHLDALFITHGDDDHDGSRQNVIDAYDPDMVVDQHHDRISTGRFVFYDLNDIESDDENESSLCEYVSLNGMKIVLTGDINQYAEERIVRQYGKLDCDILKLSHHGSKTGNCDRFLDALRPSFAAISSGPYSMYHHPSPEVIQRLLKRHITYCDTKDEGDIRIICLGPFNVLLTANGKIGLLKTGI